MRVVSLGLCAALLVACGDGDETDADTTFHEGCDIAHPECQRIIYETTAAVRGMHAPMPRVRTIGVQEFESWLKSQAGTAGDADDIWSRTLPLLRLMPEGSSVLDESVAASVSGVAAYYHPESKEVIVLDRGAPMDPLDGLLVLSHEFVHSLQDADFDLRAYLAAWGKSTDSSIAVRALVEGEATVLGLGVLARALDRPAEALNWSTATSSMREGIFRDIEASPAPLFTALQALPYPLGTSQLSTLWLQGGQPPIDALYEAPPLSVLDWSEDTRVTAATRVEALDCFPTAGPPGFVGYDHDTLGPTGLLAVGVEAGAGAAEAWTDALQIRGDSLVVFTESADPDSHAIAWRVRFATDLAAQTFGAVAAARLGARSQVVVQSREVIFYGTTKPDKLALWTGVTDCGTEEELPVRTGASDSESAAWDWPRSRASFPAVTALGGSRWSSINLRVDPPGP